MRELRAVALCLALVGCAETPKQIRTAPPARAAAPSLSPSADLPPVRLVGKRPLRANAHFVGRVVGTASTLEIVEAAKSAEAELKKRAFALGADMVQIDRVTAPPEHGGSHRRILLAGRAYRTTHKN